MADTLSLGSRAAVSVLWVDAAGQPAKVDGPTVWASTDPAIVECIVATGNPLIANLHALTIGQVQIQATADADMGSGVQSITATLDLDVIGGMATGGTLSLSNVTPPPA